MTKKHDTINRRKVILSAFFIPLAIPLVGLIFAFNELNSHFFETFFAFAILGLIYGAIFWIPSVGGCMLLERLIINENTTKSQVGLIFLVEAAVAFAIIGSLFNTGFNSELMIIPIGIAIFLTQGIRWLYLIRKNRMFTTKEVSTDDTIIDDTLL